MRYRLIAFCMTLFMLFPCSVHATTTETVNVMTAGSVPENPGDEKFWLPNGPRPTNPFAPYYLPQNMDSRYVGEEEHRLIKWYCDRGYGVQEGWKDAIRLHQLALADMNVPYLDAPMHEYIYELFEVASYCRIYYAYALIYDEAYWEVTDEESGGLPVRTSYGAAAYRYQDDLMAQLYPYIKDPSLVFTDTDSFQALYCLSFAEDGVLAVYYDMEQTDWVLFNTKNDPSELALMTLADFRAFAAEQVTIKFAPYLNGGNDILNIEPAAYADYLFTAPINPILPDYTWVWFVCGGAVVLAVGTVGAVVIVRRRKKHPTE